jgi:hypothetical protein
VQQNTEVAISPAALECAPAQVSRPRQAKLTHGNCEIGCLSEGVASAEGCDVQHQLPRRAPRRYPTFGHVQIVLTKLMASVVPESRHRSGATFEEFHQPLGFLPARNRSGFLRL